MGEFLMPSLGADMEAGKLVEWLVNPGATVKRGDILAVVETQKGAIEIEVFEDGMLDRTLVDVGAVVPVGTPLAVISGPGEVPAPFKAAPAATAPAGRPAPSMVEPPPPPSPKPAEAVTPPTAAQGAPPPAQAAAGRVRASPAARRLAEQAGIDIATVTPGGAAGEVVVADVEARLGKPTAAVAAMPQPSALSGMRAAIAAAMAHSKRDIPHYYLAHTIDLTAAETFVTRHNESREPPDRLLLGALFVKAVALAAKKYPEVNGHFVDGTFKPAASIHAGVAINIRGTGLVAPAIHDTDRLDLDTLMAAMRDLVVRVRAGRFRASEIADPTITISSMGERGVEVLYGIIYPPQVAIVGFGVPVTRPWAVDGLIGPRRVVSVTLAGDHRVSDGHRGALFLSAVADLLQKPEAL
jgi:pyruvate dehydrogenase E2 component (dihydrolipoamide acetyltransferase)